MELANDQKIEQFMCDFVSRDEDMLVNAYWLQQTLIEKQVNERLAVAQLAENNRIIEMLRMKINRLENELQTNITPSYRRLDTRA